MRMITPKGFVLLGSKSGGMRAGAHTKHTKANQPAGPLARASGSWYRVELSCSAVSCSVVSSLSLLWTCRSCCGRLQVAVQVAIHKLGTHTHTSLVHTHTSLRRKDIRSQGSHGHHTGTRKISTRKHHGVTCQKARLAGILLLWGSLSVCWLLEMS